MGVVELFINLKLRVKLLLAFGSLVLLTVLIVGVFFATLRKIGTYEKSSEEIDALSIDVLEMDAAMRHFIYEGYKSDSFQVNGKSTYLSSYNSHRVSVDKHLSAMDSIAILKNDLQGSGVQTTLMDINTHTNQLTQLLKERGFKDYGLEGALRKAIHEVENSSFPYDKVEMLMLRRHEKDFFLRKDLKYQKEFNDRIESFLDKIRKVSSADDKSEILNNAGNYTEQFNAVVEIETKIGLKENEGIKGSLNKELVTLKKTIADLRAKIKLANSE